MSIHKTLIVASAVLGLAACGPKQAPPPADQKAPEFQGGGQQGNVGADTYPGPYGIGVGSVIPNYQFYGYPRASLDKSKLQLIQMADFYNPTGDGVYPAGSPYGEGTPKPKAMVLDRSAVWCNPCNQEAATEIPAHRQTYAPQGGEFFVVLDDGPTPGTAATEWDLTGWVTKYKLDYPSAIDPNQTLSAIVGVDAYPGNIILRTKDMKIVKWIAGVPDESTPDGKAFWDTYQKVLDGQPVLPGD